MLNPFRFLACILLAASLSSAPARAQMLEVGDPLEAYARLLQLSDEVPASSFMLRPVSLEGAFGALETYYRHPWERYLAPYTRRLGEEGLRVGLLDAQLSTYYNTARPYGQNDGAVWQGKGGTVAFQAGAYARWGLFSAAVRPVFIYNQNADFELSPFVPRVGLSQYAYPYPYRTTSRIDMPQRFGAEPFSTFDLGASYVRVDYRALAAGLSNENLWWGPGVRNAIILSNNAPGVPHAFVGTGRPADIWIGRLEGRWIWGEMQESDYFDALQQNDERFLTALMLVFEPRFAPGLYLGAARSFVQNTYPNNVSFGDFFQVFRSVTKKSQIAPGNPTGEDETDQLLAFSGRYLLSESGFEVYAEWARGDHSWDMRDFVVEPEHARGYTVGLQKVFGRDARRLRLTAEHTTLGSSRTQLVRASPSFYAHSTVAQGYTQRGQVVGAGIGPGGSAQFVGLDLYAPWGKAGIGLQRQVIDNDRYYGQAAATNYQHEVEVGGLAHGLLFVKGFEVGASVGFARLFNQHYVFKNDQSNLNVGFSIRRSLMHYR